LSEEFQSLQFDEKVAYLVDHLKDIPDDIAQDGVEILAQAGETEYAVVLARDKGMIKRAIEILVEVGDYLWAGLIAKNAGMEEESLRLYRDGLEYYIEMEMYCRAVSAATALKLPPYEIDALFQKGVEVESRTMDLGRARAMIESAMDSLEIALIGRVDETADDVRKAIKDERDRIASAYRSPDDRVSKE
jgi:hypothetical protein